MEVYLSMNNLAKRLLTGAVLVIIIGGATLLGPIGFGFLLLLINGLALLEFYRLFHSTSVLPQKWGGLALSSFLFVVLHGTLNNWFGWEVMLAGVPLAFLLFVAELYRRKKHPFNNLAFTFLAVICISVPLLFFQAAAFLPLGEGYHPAAVLGYFCILWAADSGAFFTGTMFGRHKLFERISPGKTWEGSIGGALAAFMVAFLLTRLVDDRSAAEWMVMTFLVLITGTYGDFIKSLMKRSLHIKDSGTILPGHGGILDRFDTLLGSAPFIFLYLLLFAYA